MSEVQGGILFLLGAGASTDSGLPTYRGVSGIYPEDVEKILTPYTELDKIWKFLQPLYDQIKANRAGETYELIKALGEKYPGSMILTQNIDGYAKKTGLPMIELHGTSETMTCRRCKTRFPATPDHFECQSCGDYCRPDIVLFEEKLNGTKVQAAYKYLKEKPAMMIVVGTSLQFPYLKNFILKAKRKCVRVLHINPDPDYGESVAKRDVWYQLPASEGLRLFL